MAKRFCDYRDCGEFRNKNNLNPQIKFFSFPSDAKRFKKWVELSQTTSLNPKFICSKHFEDIYISYNQRRVHLVVSAIPIDYNKVASNEENNKLLLTGEEDKNEKMKVKVLYNEKHFAKIDEGLKLDSSVKNIDCHNTPAINERVPRTSIETLFDIQGKKDFDNSNVDQRMKKFVQGNAQKSNKNNSEQFVREYCSKGRDINEGHSIHRTLNQNQLINKEKLITSGQQRIMADSIGVRMKKHLFHSSDDFEEFGDNSVEIEDFNNDVYFEDYNDKNLQIADMNLQDIEKVIVSDSDSDIDLEVFSPLLQQEISTSKKNLDTKNQKRKILVKVKKSHPQTLLIEDGQQEFSIEDTDDIINRKPQQQILNYENVNLKLRKNPANIVLSPLIKRNLKVSQPDSNTNLVESNAKKVKFIKIANNKINDLHNNNVDDDDSNADYSKPITMMIDGVEFIHMQKSIYTEEKTNLLNKIEYYKNILREFKNKIDEIDLKKES